MSSILRSALCAWFAARQLKLGAHQRPPGPSIVRSADPRADRLLVIGTGITRGWGVDTHGEALVGRLSDAVGDRTGRGCDVEIVGAETMDASSALAWLGDRDLADIDAVVVALGLRDAICRTPVDEWVRDLSGLLTGLTARLRPDAAVLVVGIPPANVLPAYNDILARTSTRHRLRLNAATAYVAELHGVAHYDVPDYPVERLGRPTPGCLYSRVAAGIAAELAPTLVAARPRPEPRALPAERAGDWSGIDAVIARAADGGSPGLQRLAAAAEKHFKVELALVSLVDGDRLYYANHTEVVPEWVPFELSFCRHTVVADELVVASDADADLRFVGNALVQSSFVRFYAAYPLRAADGRVIGTFGLHGSRPRAFSADDRAALRRFATDAEAELRRFDIDGQGEAVSSGAGVAAR